MIAATFRITTLLCIKGCCSLCIAYVGKKFINSWVLFLIKRSLGSILMNLYFYNIIGNGKRRKKQPLVSTYFYVNRPITQSINGDPNNLQIPKWTN